MKKFIYLLSLIFFSFFFKVNSQTIEIDGIRYTLDISDHTASASFADANLTEAKINATVENDGVTFSVTSLAERAFFGCRNLTTISLPAGINKSGTFAFLGCNELKKVEVPSLEQWLDISFADPFANPLVYAHNLYINGVLLENLIVPEGRKTISNYTFVGSSIKNAQMAPSITEIGKHAFYECTDLGHIELGLSLTTIDTQAFDGCTALTKITFPSTLTTISGYVFNDCRALTSVTFGPSITNVGIDAFAGCESLDTINIADISSWCLIDFQSEKSNPLNHASYLYCDGKPVKSITIPSEIKEIKNATFIGCKDLEKVTLGPNVEKIGEKAFYSCTALRTVNLNEKLTTIGASAFEECEALTDCKLPRSLAQVGKYAFYGTAIIKADIPGSLTTISDGAFGECKNLSEIIFSEGIESVGFGSFYGCNGIRQVTLPSSLRKIGKSAFYGCTNLSTLSIGDRLETLSAFSFAACTSLKNIYLAASQPPTILDNTFTDYTASLHVPQTSISEYKNHAVWQRFAQILDLRSDISDIEKSTATIRILEQTLSIESESQLGLITIAALDGRVIYSGYEKIHSLSPGYYLLNVEGQHYKIKI